MDPVTLPERSPTRYGAGYAISEVFGHHVVEHAGGIPGFLSHAVRLPDDPGLRLVLSKRIA